VDEGRVLKLAPSRVQRAAEVLRGGAGPLMHAKAIGRTKPEAQRSDRTIRRLLEKAVAGRGPALMLTVLGAAHAGLFPSNSASTTSPGPGCSALSLDLPCCCCRHRALAA